MKISNFLYEEIGYQVFTRDNKPCGSQQSDYISAIEQFEEDFDTEFSWYALKNGLTIKKVKKIVEEIEDNL